ncbi:MAG: class II aldolase/adducin family protein [Chthoniobacteraceae bacterium]|jgi:rhamnose utilization protein RhaD (predicted bifunctional aldolase and dehydrogenase)
MSPSFILERLVDLSHELGRPDRHLSIIAEGNVSAALGDGTFYVKASGGQMAIIDGNGFTRVKTKVIMDALDRPDKSDREVQEVLENSRIDPQAKLPSIETFLHAICLEEGGGKWVGHTHPVSVVGILSSKLGAEPFLQHVFPDSIVVCGRRVATVPYADPGIQLAVEFRRSLRAFIEQHGAPPKVILMENHGPVALGQSGQEVLNIMLMLDKWASVLHGTYAFGGPQFLDDSISDRIESRPDEHHRRRAIGHLATGKSSN